MDEDGLERICDIGRALSDPCRVRILLNFRGRSMSISAITEELGTYQSNVSYHMSILSKAGLINRIDTGRWHYYTVEDESLDLISDFVSDCGGSAPKDVQNGYKRPDCANPFNGAVAQAVP